MDRYAPGHRREYADGQCGAQRQGAITQGGSLQSEALMTRAG